MSIRGSAPWCRRSAIPPRSADLAATLAAVDADLVLSGTPIDLAAIVPDGRGRPVLRVRYDLAELPGEPPLEDILERFFTPQGSGLPAEG